MPDEREVFGLTEMIEAFDIERVSTGGPVFDFAKLDWMNGQHIRRLSPDEFMDRVGAGPSTGRPSRPWSRWFSSEPNALSDLAAQVDYLLGDRRPLSPEDFDHKRLEPGDCKRILDHAIRRLDDLHDWNRDVLHDSVRTLAEAMDIGMRDFLAPLFMAVSGRAVSLPLFDAMAYLGRDLVRDRLRSALEALGGVSKKEAKRLERSYRDL